MRALVCGGRNIGRTDPRKQSLEAGDEIRRATTVRKFVSETLDSLHAEKIFCEIIGGDEGGAERLGISWAVANQIPRKIFTRANRTETTIKRNLRMLRESSPDLIIAIGGGESTTALLAEARRLGVPVIELAPPEAPSSPATA